jgi:endonuclease YncB( thermonuclease family)
MSETINWDEVTLANTPKFSLEGRTCHGKVVKVYDGDTMTVALPVTPRGPLFAFSCRMRGLNAAELHTTDAEEKVAGQRARDALAGLALGQRVAVTCGPFDKYGRLLADVTLVAGGLNLNAWLLREGYAVPYDGGARARWADWPEKARTASLGHQAV